MLASNSTRVEPGQYITLNLENDLPYELETVVEETDPDGDWPDTPIFTLMVESNNTIEYKVINGSGFGSEKFAFENINYNGTGRLKVVQFLDYEDPLQRAGFRFKIQVNADNRTVGQIWVKVNLRDIDDNKLQFERANITVFVRENAQVGEIVETFKATDLDQGDRSEVHYEIDQSSDRQGQFAISGNGTVYIQRQLDFETSPKHEIKILATDMNSEDVATATLTVFVQDIDEIDNLETPTANNGNFGSVVMIKFGHKATYCMATVF